MLLSKRKLCEPNQWTSGILLPYLPSKQSAVTWKTFGFTLTHLTTSNTFGLASNRYHSANIAAKKRFIASLIASSSSNPRKLWISIKTLLERKRTPLLPSLASYQSPSQMFATFFSEVFYCLIALYSVPKHSHHTQLFLFDLLKMKCLKASLSHLTLSLILIPFLHLSSNNAYLHCYPPRLTS